MVKLNNPLKPKAFELRENGYSYGQIMKILGVTSKGTLSFWFRDFKLSEEAKKKLENNIKVATERGLFLFNRNRTEKIKKENEELRSVFEFKIGELSERDMFLIGAVLYWGEGYKNFSFKKYGYPHVALGNSDPLLIKIFMKFLNTTLKIPVERMAGQVNIYPQIKPEEAIDYWHNISKIPKERIYIATAVSRASQGKRPKNLLPHGTFYIRINRRQEFFKIRGLIDGIIKAVAD